MPHLLLVTSRYYADIAQDLESGAQRALDAAGASYDIITVPGALEIPTAIRYALETETYQGFVALGCVIRGETYHFEIVCNESARGLTDLGVAYGAAIGNGIITAENQQQAKARAHSKGAGAAEAALRLLDIKHQTR